MDADAHLLPALVQDDGRFLAGPGMPDHQQFRGRGTLQFVRQCQELGLCRHGLRTGRPVFGVVDHGPYLALAGRTLDRHTAVGPFRDAQRGVESGGRGNLQVAGVAAASGPENEYLNVLDGFLVGHTLRAHFRPRRIQVH